MSTLDCSETTMRATRIQVNDDQLTVELTDGRTIPVPLDWYPRLAHAAPDERKNYQLIAKGRGIHWPQLDEEISVQNLIEGRRSGECADRLRNGWRNELVWQRNNQERRSNGPPIHRQCPRKRQRQLWLRRPRSPRYCGLVKEGTKSPFLLFDSQLQSEQLASGIIRPCSCSGLA